MMNPFFACQQRAAGCNVRPLAILGQYRIFSSAGFSGTLYAFKDHSSALPYTYAHGSEAVFGVWPAFHFMQ
jgi:hypothetical protein